MAVSILIYEDNDNLRESLCSLIALNNDYIISGAFSNSLQVKEQISFHEPDIILMDIDMPGMNGIEAVKKIRSFNKGTHIIMLTVFDDNTHVFDALSAGANGYLLKKNVSDKLISSMQEVLNGGAPMSPAIAKMIITQLQQPSAIQQNNYSLTNREKEILSLLSKGNSHKMIAAELKISIETVRTHLKKIYDKLHVHSQTEALSKAFNEKLV